MFLTILFLLLSFSLSMSLLFSFNLYHKWYFVVLFIFIIPLFYLLMFAIYCIILFFISLLFDKNKKINKPNRFYYFLVKETCQQLLILSNTKVHIIGKEKINSDKNYLVVSNHISNFDPIVAIVHLGLKTLMGVSKKENFSIPICGPFIHKAGFISLDRNNFHSSIESITQATNYLKDKSTSVYICPEGTRSKDLNLLPFHPGSFKVALNAESDIVVLYIKNTNLIAKNFPFKRTHVYLKVVNVINYQDIKGKTSLEISKEVYEMIRNEKENM